MLRASQFKLVVFDLYGTLAEPYQPLSAELGELLTELMQHYHVAVVTGVGFPEMENQFLQSFPETAHLNHLYLLPTHAAQCYVYENHSWKLKYDRSFNVFERARIMQALKEAITETKFPPAPNAAWGEQIVDRSAQITFSALGRNAPMEEKRRWDPNGERRQPFYQALVRKLPDFSVTMSISTSIDITQKGVTKAYGIRQLVQLTDISIAEMLFVGDALGDGGSDQSVAETGIRTHEVFGPEESMALIKEILRETHLGT